MNRAAAALSRRELLRGGAVAALSGAAGCAGERAAPGDGITLYPPLLQPGDLEDTGEAPYSYDRMLTQLRRVGALD